MKILFVCLGNICRSPMAEGLMKSKIENRSLQNLAVDSAGTSNYHIGESPDKRMTETAAMHGIYLSSRARQFKQKDFDEFDCIIPMDQSNKNNILKLARNDKDKNKVILMREYDEKSKGSDVPDPYFGGQKGFEEVYEILDRSTEKLLNSILEYGS